MKAYIMDGHYSIYIHDVNEFPSLIKKSLEADLKDMTGSKLKKKVILSYDPNISDNSIDFIPEYADFNGLKKIIVKMGKDSYERLGNNSSEVIRSGTSSFDLNLENNLDSLM